MTAIAAAVVSAITLAGETKISDRSMIYAEETTHSEKT